MSSNSSLFDPSGSKTESAPEVVDALIRRAEEARASDIHLQMREGTAEVAFRLDGVITGVAKLDAPLAERVFGRIKFLARLKTYQESMPQDGRIDRESVGATSDIRVSTYPTVNGEKIVLRLFRPSEIMDLGSLGFPGEVTEQVSRFLHGTSGMLLLTGPAGSGKTTTIYACLKCLADMGGRHIITVEDPAEQIVPGIMQTQINEAQGLSFPVALRHLLRQDPQILAIGEIRDEDTARIAVRAALTGHLVISTLHAASCQGVFERLLALCGDSSAVASSIGLVLNQRLIRRRCDRCGGRGCQECLHTGYRGRMPIVEIVSVNESIRRAIEARNLHEVVAIPSLEMRAKTVVQGGLTDDAEVKRALGGL